MMRAPGCLAAFAAFCVLAVVPIPAAEGPVILSPNEKLLVLPLEFAYFKVGFQSYEMDVAKSDLARQNLARSLQHAVQQKESLQFIALPELKAEEQALLAERSDLLWLMSSSAIRSLKSKTVPWRDRARWRIDYGLGSGLAFLAERTGADKALLVGGMRWEPNTAAALAVGLNFALGGLPAGNYNEKTFGALIVDLRSGEVVAVYSPVRGLEGEPSNQPGANTWIKALFDDIPKNALSEPPINQPPARKYEKHARAGFSVLPPKGWRLTVSGSSCFQRNEGMFESICIDPGLLDRKLKEKNLPAGTDGLALGEVAVELYRSDTGYTGMELVSLAPAKVAGRDGFRAELASRLVFADTSLRERHLLYGATGPGGACLLRFDAPAIYYFERLLPEFEAMVATLKLR